MRKYIKFLLIGIVATASIGALVWTYASNGEDPKIDYVMTESIIDVNNINEIIGFSDYVFTGKVLEHIGNYPSDETNNEIFPYNKYKVEVLDNYKGELQKNIEIKKIGGYENTKRGEVLTLLDETLGDTKDFLPVVGETYLFTAVADANGSIVVSGPSGHMPIKDTKDIYSIQDDVENVVMDEISFDRPRYKSVFEK